jgi:AcrR family transcriptional regulator
MSDVRAELIIKLSSLFRARGYEGVSLADISTATGLGKSSLYHHFPGGKEEMAAVVLASARAWLEAEIFAPLRTDDDPEAALRAMLAAADQLYDHGAAGCVLASLGLSAPEGPLADSVRALFADWAGAISAALVRNGLNRVEAQKRAWAALGQIQGALVLTRALRERAIFRDALGRAEAALLAPAPA